MSASPLRDSTTRLAPVLPQVLRLVFPTYSQKSCWWAESTLSRSWHSAVWLALFSWQLVSFRAPPHSQSRGARHLDDRWNNFRGSYFLPVQGNRNDRCADRHPVLFHVSAPDRVDGRTCRPRAASLEGDDLRRHRVLRTGIADRSASGGVCAAGRHLCDRSRRRSIAGDAYLSRRRRRPLDHVVFDAVLDVWWHHSRNRHGP